MTPKNQIVIFETDQQPVQVRLEGDTVWLSQAQMAELFATSTDNISLHLKNIFKDQELDEAATTEDFSVVRQGGARKVTRRLKHYNLDAIISVGYRVNSTRATRFRQWATRVLREHLTQGFSLDRQRFAQNAAELEAALQLISKAAAELWPSWQFQGRGYRIGSKSRNTAQPYDTRLPKSRSATLPIKGARRILARTGLGTATQRREQ
jgi:hypothetical protein